MNGLDTWGPRDAIVTPDNKGALVDIAAWYIMVCFILAVFVKLGIKFQILNGKLALEDMSVIVSAIANIGEVVLVSLAVRYGLGRHQKSLSDGEWANYLKMVYSIDILYFVIMLFAKLSILQLFDRLGQLYPWFLRAVTSTRVLITLWAITGVFGIAFQCGSAQPWNAEARGHTCISMPAFWEAMGPINMVTEIIIIILPIALVWNINTTLKKKMTVIIAFSFRLFVVAATLVRQVSLRETLTGTDRTYNGTTAYISTQCVLGLNIITACTPVLKPFLDAFDSGMLGISLRKHRTGQSESTTSTTRNMSFADSPWATGAATVGTSTLHPGTSMPNARSPEVSRGLSRNTPRTLYFDDGLRGLSGRELSYKMIDFAHSGDDYDDDDDLPFLTEGAPKFKSTIFGPNTAQDSDQPDPTLDPTSYNPEWQARGRFASIDAAERGDLRRSTFYLSETSDGEHRMSRESHRASYPPDPAAPVPRLSSAATGHFPPVSPDVGWTDSIL